MWSFTIIVIHFIVLYNIFTLNRESLIEINKQTNNNKLIAYLGKKINQQ